MGFFVFMVQKKSSKDLNFDSVIWVGTLTMVFSCVALY